MMIRRPAIMMLALMFCCIHVKGERDTLVSDSVHRPRLPINWLHIPKTGTSFGNTLLYYGCPSKISGGTILVKPATRFDIPFECKTNFSLHAGNRAAEIPIPIHDKQHYAPFCGTHWPIGDHEALRPETDYAKVVTFIRHPRRRIVSAFHYFTRRKNKTVSSKEICQYFDQKIYYTDKAKCTLRGCNEFHTKGGKSLASRRCSSHGSAVNMILGKCGLCYCPFPTYPDKTEAARACSLLKRFGFVGITEFWDASICLFHEIYGGAFHSNELVNVRPDSKHYPQQSADCNDQSDEYLFDCGFQVFMSRIKGTKCASLLFMETFWSRELHVTLANTIS